MIVEFSGTPWLNKDKFGSRYWFSEPIAYDKEREKNTGRRVRITKKKKTK
jgi:hypothetical protein